MATVLTGRLVTDGTGRLFIMPTDDSGEVVPAIHLADEDGIGTDELIADLQEVAWDEASHSYIAVGPNDQSHNDRFEQAVQEISGTTGPLFDEDGNLVIPGDPHHTEPLPTDAHYDESAPNKTRADTIPDEISAVATSHTEAFTS